MFWFQLFESSWQQQVYLSTLVKSFVIFLFYLGFPAVQVSASELEFRRRTALYTQLDHVMKSKCPQKIKGHVNEWKAIRNHITGFHRFQRDSTIFFEPTGLECMANILCDTTVRLNFEDLIAAQNRCDIVQLRTGDANSGDAMQDLNTERDVSSEVDETFPTTATYSKPTQVLFEVAPGKISFFFVGCVTGIIATYFYHHAGSANPANAVRLRRPEL